MNVVIIITLHNTIIIILYGHQNDNTNHFAFTVTFIGNLDLVQINSPIDINLHFRFLDVIIRICNISQKQEQKFSKQVLSKDENWWKMIICLSSQQEE